MPIKPENRHRYPPRKEWLKIRANILSRAKNCCEHCGIENYVMRGSTKIVLTIAHLDQMPENNEPSNLAALCQRCHLKHDKPYHIKSRRITMFKKAHAKRGIDLFGFSYTENPMKNTS